MGKPVFYTLRGAKEKCGNIIVYSFFLKKANKYISDESGRIMNKLLLPHSSKELKQTQCVEQPNKNHGTKDM